MSDADYTTLTTLDGEALRALHDKLVHSDWRHARPPLQVFGEAPVRALKNYATNGPEYAGTVMLWADPEALGTFYTAIGDMDQELAVFRGALTPCPEGLMPHTAILPASADEIRQCIAHQIAHKDLSAFPDSPGRRLRQDPPVAFCNDDGQRYWVIVWPSAPWDISVFTTDGHIWTEHPLTLEPLLEIL